jgi:metallo-beta-lactamase family protein
MGQLGKKKKDEEVKITLLGNNAVGVTQSCTKIDFMDKVYLLECGGYQEGTIQQNYDMNARLVNSIEVDDIQAIFAFHVHQDHVQNIPAIVGKAKGNFKGKIYCTYETSQLLYPLLMDSSYLLAKEAEALSKKKGFKIQPLFTENDVIETMRHVEICELNKTYHISDNVWFNLLPNSHIIGASQGEIYFKTQSNKIRKLLYTSDLGSQVNKKPFVNDTQFCTKANIVFMESTYGLKSRTLTKQDRKDDLRLIESLVKEVLIENNGRILIPCFSLDRTQHLLKIVYDLFHDKEYFKEIPVVIDSKLALEVTNGYKKVLSGEHLDTINTITSWENVKFIRDIHECKLCVGDKSPKIVISASGFIEGGHSQLYTQEYLNNSNDCILFCGYSSENSVAGRIKNSETKTIKIGDKVCKKSCRIEQLKTFSSHAQHNELINYAKQINCEKIYLIHGDGEAKKELQLDMIDELKNIGKTTQIICGQKNMVIEL